jgi:hypothetical protein
MRLGKRGIDVIRAAPMGSLDRTDPYEAYLLGASGTRAAIAAEVRRLRDELAARGQPQSPEWAVRLLAAIEAAA